MSLENYGFRQTKRRPASHYEFLFEGKWSDPVDKETAIGHVAQYLPEEDRTREQAELLFGHYMDNGHIREFQPPHPSEEKMAIDDNRVNEQGGVFEAPPQEMKEIDNAIHKSIMGDYARSQPTVVVRMPRRKKTTRRGYRSKRRFTKLPTALRDLVYGDRLSKYKNLDGTLTAIPERGSARNLALFGPSERLASADQLRNRRAVGFRGRGDYDWKPWAKWGSRAIGGLAGGALGWMAGGGTPLGAASGAATGYGHGAAFSKMMGWGDYGSVNSLIADASGAEGGAQQQISVNKTSASGDIFIEHTEFVQNIVASVTSAPAASSFQISSFPLNVGIGVTFPFLSQIAQNYVLYEFQGLMYQYKPTSGEYGNNSSNSIGKVVLATQYDPDAIPFQSSVQMENYDYANSTKPSCGAIHGVETKPGSSNGNMLYVRTGVSSKSKVFTDLGQFQIATEGIPFGGSGAQSAIIGELWVTYRVRLSRANLYGSLLGLNIDQDVFRWNCSASAFYASTQLNKATNTLGCTVTNVSSTAVLVTFPANVVLGAYQLTIVVADTVNMTGQIFAAPTNLQNATYCLPGEALPQASAVTYTLPTVASPTSNRFIGQVIWLNVSAPGALQASVQFNLSAVLAATASARLFITQINQPSVLSLA